jgi:hypothetical protein
MEQLGDQGRDLGRDARTGTPAASKRRIFSAAVPVRPR